MDNQGCSKHFHGDDDTSSRFLYFQIESVRYKAFFCLIIYDYRQSKHPLVSTSPVCALHIFNLLLLFGLDGCRTSLTVAYRLCIKLEIMKALCYDGYLTEHRNHGSFSVLEDGNISTLFHYNFCVGN